MSVVGVFLAGLLAGTVTTSTEADFENVLTRHTKLQYVGDLEEVKRRGVLRVLTRNNSSSYFSARGRQRALQFEAAKRFADHLGGRLAMVVPSSRAGLVPALLAGDGDMIAAGMTPTPARGKLVSFTGPLFESQRTVVTHEHIIKLLERPEDLPQVEVHVSFRSTTYARAKALEKALGVTFRLAEVPPDVEMEEMIRRVASGQYEATIADENILAIEQHDGAPVVGRVALGEPLDKVWAVRPSSVVLLAAANDFVARHKKDGLLRILWHKYYSTRSKRGARARESDLRADATQRISPYDEMFKAMGQEVEIDWRLLAAVAYSESRFDPTVQSRFGATGLMQVLPSTAKRHGRLKGDVAAVTARLKDPATNIRVGSRYLKWLMARFEGDGVDKRQVIRFALAAYNVGIGHLIDARELAKNIGLDPNRWFHNVEKALRLKKDRKWHSKTRYGFCRAEQPIAYVSRIQTRYDVYVRHVDYE